MSSLLEIEIIFAVGIFITSMIATPRLSTGFCKSFVILETQPIRPGKKNPPPLLEPNFDSSFPYIG